MLSATAASASPMAASAAKRERPISGTSYFGKIGEASMSCCSSSVATTTSPTFTPGANPPATPVNTIARTPKRSSSTVAVTAAATLPMRDSTATTGWPCRWPTQKSRPATRTRCSSGMRARSALSSSCMAATMAMGAATTAYLMSTP
ncbi:hypothetical protein D3C72_835560 [compost metagenome]